MNKKVHNNINFFCVRTWPRWDMIRVVGQLLGQLGHPGDPGRRLHSQAHQVQYQGSAAGSTGAPKRPREETKLSGTPGTVPGVSCWVNWATQETQGGDYSLQYNSYSTRAGRADKSSCPRQDDSPLCIYYYHLVIYGILQRIFVR